MRRRFFFFWRSARASESKSGAMITSLKISLIARASGSVSGRLQMIIPPKGACLSVANALSHAFGGESGAASAQGLGGFGGLGGGDNARVDAGQGSNEGITDSLYQNAAEDEQGDDPGDDFNGDSGDDGDWT